MEENANHEVLSFIDKELKLQSSIKWEKESLKNYYEGYKQALRTVRNHITGDDKHIYSSNGGGNNVKVN